MRYEVPGVTIADINTSKPIPLVLYEDDHAADPHTHDVDGHGTLRFRYPYPRKPRRTRAVRHG